MTPKEKIKWVRDRINGLAEMNPAGGLYYDVAPVIDVEANGGIPDEAHVILSRSEQRSIIRKLEEEGFVKNVTFDEDKRGVWFEMVPRGANKKEHPEIREQTLEYISRHLGERGSGPQIVGWLEGWGVPNWLIEYPNTKWRMIHSVLSHYAYSTGKKDREMLFRIIGEMLHPLMFGGDKKAAEAAAKDFNKYLEYDGVVAAYSGDDKRYYVYKEDELGVDEDDLHYALNEKLILQEYSELEFLRLPENKERVAALREAYRAFINIVHLFCRNPLAPTTELNNAYLECKSLITSTVSKLDLYNFNKVYRLATYSLPFVTLFSAEKNCQQNGTILSWNAIRPEMYATYSDIEEIYRKAHSTGVPQEPDSRKILAEVSSLVAKAQAQNRKRDAQVAEKVRRVAKEKRVLKVEIAKMPTLKIRGEKVPIDKPVKTTLHGKPIEFDETRPAILVDGKRYQLPPAQNEDYLARVMFRHRVGEFVDWSMIYSEMTGADPQETDIENPKNMKMVRDTMNRLNGRLQELLNTEDDLLAWKNKSICRNY
jgi:hypothetical protein